MSDEKFNGPREAYSWSTEDPVEGTDLQVETKIYELGDELIRNSQMLEREIDEFGGEQALDEALKNNTELATRMEKNRERIRATAGILAIVGGSAAAGYGIMVKDIFNAGEGNVAITAAVIIGLIEVVKRVWNKVEERDNLNKANQLSPA